MGFKQYKAFYTCVETGSVSDAAKRLDCSQSAISHLLADLEEETGFSVLIRNKGGIRLTEKGRLLYEDVKLLMESETKVLDKIRLLSAPEQKTIRVGTFTSVAVHWLPSLIKGYEAKNHGIKFEITDGGYKDIADAVKKGKVDVGFVGLPIDGKCLQIPLYKDRLLAVLPKNYPLSGAFPIKKFTEERVITLTEDTDWDSRRVFSQAGIQPNIKYKTSDDYAMIAMAEQGLGVCVMPELLLRGRDGNLKTAELDPPAYRTIGLAVTAGKESDPLIEDFIEFIKGNLPL
ncbi:MAG: LysR family transcriptional regulator [Clostridia bacterium]|nr:LysR family transcriptional regulator [Clostridia bacterium]